MLSLNQLPAAGPFPKLGVAKVDVSNVPSARPNAVYVPAKPKPTMSARASPFTSPRTRGFWSWLTQPPAAALVPNAFDVRVAAAKVPSAWPSAVKVPPKPNPTMSARPSPFTSPSSRVAWSSLNQPPATAHDPKTFDARMGAVKVPLAWPNAVKVPPKPKPTMSARPSPFTSPRSRGFWSWLVQPPATAPAPNIFDARIGG